MILAVTSPEELLVREQALMDANPGRKLYNSSRTAGNCLGVKHSAETRAKLSAQRKGRKHTAEAKAKVAAAKTGLVIPPEVRAKIGATQRKLQTGRMKANNTSGFYGVTRDTKGYGWVARIRIDGRRHYLGAFASPEAANSAIVAFMSIAKPDHESQKPLHYAGKDSTNR